MRELFIVLLIIVCLAGITEFIDNWAGRAVMHYLALSVAVIYVVTKLFHPTMKDEEES